MAIVAVTEKDLDLLDVNQAITPASNNTITITRMPDTKTGRKVFQVRRMDARVQGTQHCYSAKAAILLLAWFAKGPK